MNNGITFSSTKDSSMTPLASSSFNPNPSLMGLFQTKILKSVWAMKRKADRTKRVQLDVKGCRQVADQHYDADNISSPVTNTFSIHIVFMIMLMCGSVGWVVDVNGAFLLGEFKKGDLEI
jgi:hypothetical protein